MLILYIKQPGSQIRYKGKNYRTPVKLNILESDKDYLINLLNYKAIVDYEIYDEYNKIIEEKKVSDINNRMKKFINLESNNQIFEKNNNLKIGNRVVKNLKHMNKNYIEDNNLYHKTIEDEMDIDIDLSTSDILKHLLETI